MKCGPSIAITLTYAPVPEEKLIFFFSNFSSGFREFRSFSGSEPMAVYIDLVFDNIKLLYYVLRSCSNCFPKCTSLDTAL